MPVQLINYSLPPVNETSTSVVSSKLAGGFSYNKGNMNIKFSIGSQPRMILTDEMYLTGQIVFLDNNGATVNPLPTGANEALATYNSLNGSAFPDYNNLNFANYAGIQSVIKRVFVQSKKSSVELSHHNNYPSHVDIMCAHKNSDEDFLISPLIRQDAGGTKAKFLNRHAVAMPNCTESANEMTNLNNGGINDRNFGKPFSFKIETPLLDNIKMLDLSEQNLGGLVVNIELQNSAGVFHQSFREMGTGQTASSIDGYYYLLKNLRLEGRMAVPTPDEVSNYNSQLILKDRLDLLNDVQASVNSNQLTPNVSQARGFTNLFTDQDQENNYKFNQNNHRLPLALRSYTNLKNQTRNPQDFKVEVSPNLLTDTAFHGVAGTISAQNYTNKIMGQGSAEVINFYQRAILNGRLANKTINSLKLQDSVLNSDYEERGATAQTEGVGEQTSADVNGIGLDLSAHLGNYTNYQNSNYDLAFQSGVNMGNAKTNLPASRRDKTELVLTYVNINADFNTKTLQRTF